MWDLKACTVCFSAKRKLHKIHQGSLREYYFSVTGIKPEETLGMPQYLCVECAAYVKSFKKFQNRCQRAHFTLKELLKRDKEIKLSTLEAIDRELLEIESPLSFLKKHQAHYNEDKFQWTKTNRLGVAENQNIFIQHCGTFKVDDIFESLPKKPRLCFDGEDIKIETDDGQTLGLQFAPIELIEHSINESNINPINQLTQSTSDGKSTDFFFNDDHVADDDIYDDNQDSKYLEVESTYSTEQQMEDNVDGSNLDEEYASIVLLTSREAKAVVDIYKSMTYGKHKCEKCDRNFRHEESLRGHMRMHDQSFSGTFLCNLCQYYYKTDYLLKTHVNDKHLYKYLCRSCNEVNYDRVSAKQHYIWAHLQKEQKRDATWCEANSNLTKRKYKKGSLVATMTPVKKKINTKDTLKSTPLSQEEQYALVLERKKSRNYLDAQFKCEYCFRGFRETATFEKHMRKHDPEVSGKLQCDMCKLYFRDTRKMYKHMRMLHLFKWTCLHCNFHIYNRGQAVAHYKEHKNVTYKCEFCDLSFKKASTRLTHIRIKHPSTYICTICGHSFVSEMGLHCHTKLTHTAMDMEKAATDESARDGSTYCAECDLLFLSDTAFKTHLGSSSRHATTNLAIQRGAKKPRRSKARPEPGRTRGRPGASASDIVNNGLPTATHCEVCGKYLSNDVQARKHYEAEHPGTDFLKRYMCDVCGHTTKQYANLLIHMRKHTNEKPYPCPHCDRRFSMSSNRDRHIVVHTGEKPYQCQHCSRRFSQSAAVKLHIQTVHLKIPYAPWSKANRKRRRKEIQGPVAPLVEPPCLPPPAPHPKLMTQVDARGDYLNAYITYNDE